MLVSEQQRTDRHTREIYFYIPRNFDAERVLPPELRKYADCANYLVSRAVCGRIHPGRADVDGYVRLHVQTLRNIIPDRVEKRIRDSVIEAEVLEHDPTFEKGRRSMGYRLGPGYAQTRHRRVLCRDRELADRIRHATSGAAQNKVHRHLANWLDRLDIDMAMAKAITAEMELGHLHLTAAEMIAQHDGVLTVCDYGRVHTPVTNLKRALRPTLHFQGKPLINIDITNSQPLILGIVLMICRLNGGKSCHFKSAEELIRRRIEEHWHSHVRHLFSDETFHEIMLWFRFLNTSFPSSTTAPSKYPNYSNTSPAGPGRPHTLSNRPQPLPEKWFTPIRSLLAEDEIQYLKACETGTLYEVIQASAGDTDLDRTSLKEAIFRDVLYGRPRNVTRFTKAFERLYPSVLDLVRKLKANDYRRLAWLMQRFESGLMIGAVCGRIMEERPDVPLVTVHDSIATTPENVEYVVSVVKEEFLRVGIKPAMKTELWTKAPGSGPQPNSSALAA